MYIHPYSLSVQEGGLKGRIRRIARAAWHRRRPLHLREAGGPEGGELGPKELLGPEGTALLNAAA